MLGKNKSYFLSGILLAVAIFWPFSIFIPLPHICLLQHFVKKHGVLKIFILGYLIDILTSNILGLNSVCFLSVLLIYSLLPRKFYDSMHNTLRIFFLTLISFSAYNLLLFFIIGWYMDSIFYIYSFIATFVLCLMFEKIAPTL